METSIFDFVLKQIEVEKEASPFLRRLIEKCPCTELQLKENKAYRELDLSTNMFFGRILNLRISLESVCDIFDLSEKQLFNLILNRILPKHVSKDMIANTLGTIPEAIEAFLTQKESLD